MKIYVITAGYYSDYHIEMVTVDKNKAEAYYQCLNDSSAYIEEFDDGLITVEPIWYVYRSQYGFNALLQDLYQIQKIDLDNINNVLYQNGMYEVYVRAKDKDTAEKIAIDLFAQYRAEKEGIV